jgi:hypothetical protein
MIEYAGNGETKKDFSSQKCRIGWLAALLVEP